MKQSRILDMVQRYPPLMELNPNTVREHLDAIREAVLLGNDTEIERDLLRAALYTCPSWLGMKPESMKAKVEMVRASVKSLYSKASDGDHDINVNQQARSLILGYPNLLALGHKKLEEKFNRLEDVVCLRPDDAPDA